MNVIDAIKERRSLRAIEPTQINDENIKDLAISASLAPSCYNKQPWKFVFVRNQEILKNIFGVLSQGNEWAFNSSLIIAVCGKKEDDCIVGNREYFLFDIGMATNQILLRATEMGFATHIIAGFSQNKVKDILDIPDEMLLISLIVVGGKMKDINESNLPAELLEIEKERPERFKIKEFAYIDKYNIYFQE